MNSFNLIDEPWVKVGKKDGMIEEKSLRDIFHEATSIRDIIGDDAMQRMALYRLLIAIMYGAYPEPMCKQGWYAMKDDIENGRMGAIDQYLDKWHDRFDLFDPTYPFMQTPEAKWPDGSKNKTDLGKLVLSLPLNARAFNAYRSTDDTHPITAADAARNLVELQAYGYAGVRHKLQGQPKEWERPKGTGWAGMITCTLIEGSSLAETLAYNRAGMPAACASQWVDDKPIWERGPNPPQIREELTQGKNGEGDRSKLHGPATLMTFPRFRVLLDVRAGGTVGPDSIIANGDRVFVSDAYPMETMSAWVKAGVGMKPKDVKPKRIAPDMQLWRGIGPLLARNGDYDATMPPVTVLWLKEMRVRNVPLSISTVTVEYDKQGASVIDRVYSDRLDMRLSTLTDLKAETFNDLLDSVSSAEKYMTAFGWLCQGLEDCRRKQSDKKDAKREQAERIAGKKANAWALLDAPFRQVVSDLDGDADHCEDIIRSWNEAMHGIFVQEGKRLASASGADTFHGRLGPDGELLNAGTVLNKYLSNCRNIKEDPQWGTKHRKS